MQQPQQMVLNELMIFNHKTKRAESVASNKYVGGGFPSPPKRVRYIAAVKLQ